MVNCMGCTRRLTQFVLIAVNILVALLGLAVMIIGIWAKVNEKEYFKIAEDSEEFTQITVLMIVVGLFILIIGAVGSIGALFAGYVFGRIVLGLYAIVLSALIICEISGGIAAAVLNDRVETLFRRSANDTFQDYNNTQSTWRDFQEEFECCGVDGYKDYYQLWHNHSVPTSCCNRESLPQGLDCPNVTMDVTDNTKFIYTEGCVDAVIDQLKHNLGALAGGAITIGILQIVGVVMACFVAFYKGPETNKYEVV